jgi:hypothetical protein
VADGKMRCWGDDTYDVMGTRRAARATEPVPVTFKR